jgi:ectoine hydroxylase-related dioxygenase (phytanoyl-CoA dioxygenase family)
MEELNKNGYIIFKNGIYKNDIPSDISNIKEKVNYTQIKDFIDQIFIPTIKRKLPSFSNPKYTKFRYSNNNNSIDASVFHQDVYNTTDLKLMPIYTALVYFDKAELELIPGSHIQNNLNLINLYNNKIVLHLEPNDIVVFHSNMYHKGVNFSQGNNRRLLQVFDVFPDNQTYNELFHKFKIVNTSDGTITKKNAMYYISQNKTAIDLFNHIVLFMVYFNLQYKFPMKDLPPSQKNNSFISYQPSGHLFYKQDLVDEVNINIICDKDVNIVDYSRYYLFLFLFVLLLFSILYLNLYKK